MRHAILLNEIGCELGEGCVWDEKRKRLYFIDISGKQRKSCISVDLSCLENKEG